jgi:hypothetical protein
VSLRQPLDTGDLLENAHGCRWRVTHDQQEGDTHVAAVIVEPRDDSPAAARLDDIPVGLHTSINLLDLDRGIKRV